MTSCSTLAPEITLSHGGKLRGATVKAIFPGQTKSVDHFLGIPFAKPPIKELRFASPEIHEGWKDFLDVVKLPPTCWQYIFSGFDIVNAGARMWVNNTEMSEDCLYLNVWRPSGISNANLPVMVWVYGGGYTTGTSTLEVYNGTYLAAKHDVIVVSMQYRLGAFGFLRINPRGNRFNREPVNSTKLALGNMGLKDQLLALEWVQNEIRNFGGDPNEVTVFGESSGAVSVSALWISPKAKTLFKRAIIQSGSIFARWGLHDLHMANHRAAVVSSLYCPSAFSLHVLSTEPTKSLAREFLSFLIFKCHFSVLIFPGDCCFHQSKMSSTEYEFMERVTDLRVSLLSGTYLSWTVNKMEKQSDVQHRLNRLYDTISSVCDMLAYC